MLPDVGNLGGSVRFWLRHCSSTVVLQCKAPLPLWSLPEPETLQDAGAIGSETKRGLKSKMLYTRGSTRKMPVSFVIIELIERSHSTQSANRPGAGARFAQPHARSTAKRSLFLRVISRRMAA